jgi:xylan 1,4-beta-xylosidase
MLPALARSINSYDVSDTVKVVKGQVSNYYISVHHTYEITGCVIDEKGTPLEGATVMFFASPCHCNTDAHGNYHLIASDEDLSLYVYYPGKDFAKVTRKKDERKINITMREKTTADMSLPRHKAEATPWFDPYQTGTSTYCNPLNISYNYEPYNNNVKAGGSFRSAADPMALTYKGHYMLFSTNQGGFHYSKNLSDWDFCQASFQRYPTDDDQCAPAAYVAGDTLFYTGSTYRGLPVWYTLNPWSGHWCQAIDRNTLPSWDPCLFLDDDGKLYLYYGSSNEYPIKGVEISRSDFAPISKIHDLVMLDPKQHGWERFGMNNDDEVTLKPFIEGSYMTKYKGKYYLQYGGPGTEFKIYADGVYVGDSPLGPFTYQKHNPMCYKPGGFVQGAGHGGTFADLNGNYWHVATCMLSLKYKFERRIGLYPVAFDKEGIMYSNTAFGDYPCWNADKNLQNPADRFTGWMLLSYGKKATVSSVDSIYAASNLTDENLRTYWAAKTGNPEEWAQVDLGAVKSVKAIQLNFYDQQTVQTNRANDLYYQYRIWASDNGTDWKLAVDKSDNDKDAPHDYIELKSELLTRYIKIENLHMPSEGCFCLSEIRIFGKADGERPATVKGLTVNRSRKDSRNALISWLPSVGAYGYNIYYGIAAGKMYNSITVLGSTSYDFRGLDADSHYCFTIEALGETGRSDLSKIIKK